MSVLAHGTVQYVVCTAIKEQQKVCPLLPWQACGLCIRQHSSAVYMYGGGCLYRNTMKTRASVLQSGKLENRTVEGKVCTVHKTMITVLPRENIPARKNVHGIF